jgi:uncharacterized protein (DUF433 family)
MTTTASWISQRPDRCGGDACIRDTRITVWGLVEWRRLGLSDDAILRSIPGLTPADLETAWEYATAHPEEIDQAIEDFHFGVVERLRALGHDVVTVQEASRSGSSDAQVLADATAGGRAVLTFNRRHFGRLHRHDPSHTGIISCTRDDDQDGLTSRIEQILTAAGSLAGQHLRVNRPLVP